ncbi:MAG: AbrB/MazE/SpoVT family DNA-binding domain-containing protein [Elusimicrobiota bacterium]
MRTTTIRPLGPRNQVTIPSEILKQLHMKAHDLVSFVLTKEGLLMKPVEIVDKNDSWEKNELAAIEKLIHTQVKDKDFVKISDSEEAVSYLKKRIKCK